MEFNFQIFINTLNIYLFHLLFYNININVLQCNITTHLHELYHC